MNHIPPLAEVKSDSKLNLGNFDYDRIARSFGGLISREEIGEILVATKDSPELIDFLLASWVKSPRRICRGYHGTYCRLLDYRISPERPDLCLYISRMSGAVLSESWGEHRKGGLPNGIFDAAAIIFDLTAKKDFPKVYRIVREGYEAFKRLPAPNEALEREIKLKIMRGKKERCLPSFPSTRKTFSARQLWQAFPIEIREEEFGGSFYRFKDILEYLAREDPTDGPFRVERIPNGNDSSRFRLIGDE